MELLGSMFSGAGSLIMALVVLYIVIRILQLPFKFLYNGIVGAIFLWLFNIFGGLIGLTIKINIINALIAGIFGIPGVAAILLWNLITA